MSKSDVRDSVFLDIFLAGCVSIMIYYQSSVIFSRPSSPDAKTRQDCVVIHILPPATCPQARLSAFRSHYAGPWRHGGDPLNLVVKSICPYTCTLRQSLDLRLRLPYVGDCRPPQLMMMSRGGVVPEESCACRLSFFFSNSDGSRRR